MRVGILIDRLAPGSAPKAIGQAVRGLRELGHDCEAVVIRGGYTPTYDFHLRGVPIRVLSDSFPAWARKLDFRFPGFSFFATHHLLSALLAPRVVRDREWDVLVTHSTYTCFTSISLKRRRGIPYIPFIWDPASYIFDKVYRRRGLGRLRFVLLPLARWLDQWILRDCQAVITSGRLHHERLRQFTGKPLEILVPGCFPLEELPRWQDREDIVLAFDRWDIGNTPTLFLDMIQRMQARARLVVAGHWYPESLRDEFLREVERRGLSGRVQVEGPLDEQRIRYWCARSRAHVHPNEEAFGMQCLEAAGCGCPFVIPRGSGVTELFEHGVHGFFPNTSPLDRFKGDMTEYAAYVERILRDPALGEAMGREAWKIARQYTWERHALQLHEILAKHAGQTGG